MRVNQRIPTIRFTLRLCRRATGYVAVAGVPGEARSRMGHGPDREAAIADALHRCRIFYAGPDIERDVIVAETRRDKVDLVLVDDTVHFANANTKRRVS